jgi:hypothetical protein
VFFAIIVFELLVFEGCPNGSCVWQMRASAEPWKSLRNLAQRDDILATRSAALEPAVRRESWTPRLSRARLMLCEKPDTRHSVRLPGGEVRLSLGGFHDSFDIVRWLGVHRRELLPALVQQ